VAHSFGGANSLRVAIHCPIGTGLVAGLRSEDQSGQLKLLAEVPINALIAQVE
jgi:hypothetical protein